MRHEQRVKDKDLLKLGSRISLRVGLESRDTDQGSRAKNLEYYYEVHGIRIDNATTRYKYSFMHLECAKQMAKNVFGANRFLRGLRFVPCNIGCVDSGRKKFGVWELCDGG